MGKPRINFERMTAKPKSVPTPDGLKKRGRPKGIPNKSPKDPNKPKAPPQGRTPRDQISPSHWGIGESRIKSLEENMRLAFGHLSAAELDAISPLEVLQYCTIAAIKANRWDLALMAAERWAPYRHAKLAPKLVDVPDAQQVIVIEGGLPQDEAPTLVAVGEVVIEDDNA